MTAGFPAASLRHPDARVHREQIAQAANLALSGKINATLDVTLTVSATTTTVTDNRITSTSFIAWMPKTASAATASPSVWVSSQTAGSCVLTHASNAATDQNMRLLVIG